MTDRCKPRLALAKVRVTGPPEVVDQVVDAITDALPSAAPSRPYPSRHDSGHVRVYLEVTPNEHP
ncbi:hypothetical protein [Nocardiopsis ansamitocini]|uniref:Uncharacterized protein n=1 Tax=Nocardiopsis ansamitocini TaxID=1670832 RepID=A0A9W6P2Z2_9ACTN|nr:hypothetical protein [Nocardiopsis ansamitocini]GLU46315.1 hypothetical protein Nans01_06660 [Nocardiopsis ansamitocini]